MGPCGVLGAVPGAHSRRRLTEGAAPLTPSAQTRSRCVAQRYSAKQEAPGGPCSRSVHPELHLAAPHCRHSCLRLGRSSLRGSHSCPPFSDGTLGTGRRRGHTGGKTGGCTSVPSSGCRGPVCTALRRSCERLRGPSEHWCRRGCLARGLRAVHAHLPGAPFPLGASATGTHPPRSPLWGQRSLLQPPSQATCICVCRSPAPGGPGLPSESAVTSTSPSLTRKSLKSNMCSLYVCTKN